MQSSDDLEFVLKGGESKEIDAINQVNAMNRINTLVRKEIPDFDIRMKSPKFLEFLDLTLIKKYERYRNKEQKIDEQFCKDSAEVCIEMEKDEPTLPS